MKRIKTIHPKTIVGSTEYIFAPVAGDANFYEGEVPDDVFEVLMQAKRPLGKTGLTDWMLVPSPAVVKVTEPESCYIVGCDKEMPHEHKIEGPVEAPKK